MSWTFYQYQSLSQGCFTPFVCFVVIINLLNVIALVKVDSLIKIETFLVHFIPQDRSNLALDGLLLQDIIWVIISFFVRTYSWPVFTFRKQDGRWMTQSRFCPVFPGSSLSPRKTMKGLVGRNFLYFILNDWVNNIFVIQWSSQWCSYLMIIALLLCLKNKNIRGWLKKNTIYILDI